MSPPRRGRVACCAWTPLLLLTLCACRETLAAPASPPPAPAAFTPARRGYCERADPAWRAFLAPIAFEGRVQSVSSEDGEKFVTMQVRRVLRQQAHWPRRDAVLQLRLAPAPAGCVGRFEILEPLRNKRNYIVFAERRGRSAVALGPPLKRSRKLLRRITAVYKPGYGRAARVQALRPARVAAAAGARVRLECAATARPPPRISWYRDGRLLGDTPRRIRVTNYRRKSVLEIRHARRGDSARYECRAVGAVGPPASAAANVTIGAPHHQPPTDDDNSIAWGAPCPMPDPGEFCLNGGTCLFFEQVREPACKCPEGFNGQRCENKDVSNRSSMYHSYTCKLGLSTSYYC